MATGFKHGIELLLFFGLHFENVFLDGLTRNQFVIVDDFFLDKPEVAVIRFGFGSRLDSYCQWQ